MSCPTITYYFPYYSRSLRLLACRCTKFRRFIPCQVTQEIYIILDVIIALHHSVTCYIKTFQTI